MADQQDSHFQVQILHLGSIADLLSPAVSASIGPGLLAPSVQRMIAQAA